MCDRKFYVRDLVKVSRAAIEEQQGEIEGLRMQVASLNEACNGLDDEFKKYKEQLLEETAKVRDQKKKSKKVKKAMTQEVHTLTDECTTLTLREEQTVKGI